MVGGRGRSSRGRRLVVGRRIGRCGACSPAYPSGATDRSVVDRPGDEQVLAWRVAHDEALVRGTPRLLAPTCFPSFAWTFAALHRVGGRRGRRLGGRRGRWSEAVLSWSDGGATVVGAVARGGGRRWRHCGRRRRDHGDGGWRHGDGGDRRLRGRGGQRRRRRGGGRRRRSCSTAAGWAPPRCRSRVAVAQREEHDTPITHSASTAPATTRAAVTYCVARFSPRERRMRSAARAASTKATIVPMSGMTMLTIAHTSAAMANGSTRGCAPPPTRAAATGRAGRLRLGPDRHRARCRRESSSARRAVPKRTSGNTTEHVAARGVRLGRLPSCRLRPCRSPATPRPTSCSSPIRSRS